MESEKEVAKVNLQALIAANSIPFDNQEAASKWEQKIKKVFTNFLELEYGIKIPENTKKELDMMKFYKDKVKVLKPKAVLKKGKLVVSGLDSLKE